MDHPLRTWEWTSQSYLNYTKTSLHCVVLSQEGMLTNKVPKSQSLLKQGVPCKPLSTSIKTNCVELPTHYHSHPNDDRR